MLGPRRADLVHELLGGDCLDVADEEVGVDAVETLIEQNVVAFGEVARLYEQAGFTHLLAISNFGGLPHKQVLSSMALLARHVLPRFAPA